MTTAITVGVVRVCFACNCSTNGEFGGRCSQFVFESKLESATVGMPIEAFSHDPWGPRFRQDETRFKVARRWFHKTPRPWSTWVGNWCWDACDMETKEAIRLLRYLKSLGGVLESGPTRVFDLWDKIQEPTT